MESFFNFIDPSNLVFAAFFCFCFVLFAFLKVQKLKELNGKENGWAVDQQKLIFQVRVEFTRVMTF